MKQNRYLLGILLVISGGVCLSISGILLRIMDNADGWQIIFFRSIAFFCTILTILVFKYGRKTFAAYRAVGILGLVAATLLSLGSVLYIFAMLNTTVANVVFIIGSSPLVTALVAWLFLKEKLSAWRLATMVVAVLGIGLMFIDGFVSGGLLGNILAMCMVFVFAFYLLILRAKKDVDMVPATGLSGLLTFAVAAIMVSDLNITAHDLLICIVLGSLQFGLGFFLLTLGTRFIPAAEVALFALSESALGPIWVWIGVNEVPGNYTFFGGGIVLASVITYSLIAIRHERQLHNHLKNQSNNPFAAKPNE
ncbi:DMT family transporter [Candidatus Spongiihabitans sp.]|uniref:DMT family transporter n=1 Tax=Candidatus Spongiihabitans sp. TaxID=3101308 RepID=UPI003C6FA34C